ncbi:GNAT family N-acetyltransferase [Erwinia sp. CPCC 100877]|nr:GNAT family N-acetyltransferase [Erwinia sp. CPCC 100877]
MNRIIQATPQMFPALTDVWEASVRATHHFLPEGEIETLRPLVRDRYIPELRVYVCLDDEGTPLGFMGTGGERLEMLFVAPEAQGQGVGKALLRYGVEVCGVRELDVNEQNPQACNFYRHMGFEVIGRSERDGEGRPFPLLRMRLADE